MWMQFEQQNSPIRAFATDGKIFTTELQATFHQICKITLQLKLLMRLNNHIQTTKIFSVPSSPDPKVLKKIAVRSSPDPAKIGVSPDPVRSNPDPCSSLQCLSEIIGQWIFTITSYPVYEKRYPYPIQFLFWLKSNYPIRKLYESVL